jgi:hypothetical protein
MLWHGLDSCSTFFEEPRNSTGIKDNVVCILMVELLWNCVIDQLSTNNAVMSVLIYIIEAIPLALWALKSTHGTHSDSIVV